MVARALLFSLLAAAMVVCCVCDTPQFTFMKQTQEKFQNNNKHIGDAQKDIVQLATSFSPVNSDQGTEDSTSTCQTLKIYFFF